jgi:hypothetical protein
MPNPPPDYEPIAAAPSGHIHLILVREPHFYLQIPLDIICSLCLKPRKYLVFLGWCILGVEGGLAECPNNEQMDLEGALDDKGLYYYVKDDDTCTGRFCFYTVVECPLAYETLTNGSLSNTDLSMAVDIEVIKQRSNVPSETTESRSDFRNQLLIRDACCVFTGSSDRFGSGMHIIPYKRGSEVCSEVLLHLRDI